jgi:hypothetical protein
VLPSKTASRKPSSTMNFTTISIQELWSLICQKLRNNCIVFEELPGSIGDLTFADAVSKTKCGINKDMDMDKTSCP